MDDLEDNRGAFSMRGRIKPALDGFDPQEPPAAVPFNDWLQQKFTADTTPVLTPDDRDEIGTARGRVPSGFAFNMVPQTDQGSYERGRDSARGYLDTFAPNGAERVANQGIYSLLDWKNYPYFLSSAPVAVAHKWTDFLPWLRQKSDDSVEGLKEADDLKMRGEDTSPAYYKVGSNALDVASTLPLGGLAAAKAGVAAAPEGAVHMFAGGKAKTAKPELMAKAEKMLADGVPREQVWSETGHFKGPDGKMRFEIDDSGATGRHYQLTPQKAYEQARERAFIDDDITLRDRANSMKPYADQTKRQLVDEYKRTGGEIADAAQSGDTARALEMSDARSGLDSILSEMASAKYGPFSGYVRHPDLGLAYPDVYKMHTRLDGDLGDRRAYYHPGSVGTGEQIVLREKPSWSRPLSVALHEAQHAIQSREGFSRGASTQPLSAGSIEHIKNDIAGNVKNRIDDSTPLASSIVQSARLDFPGFSGNTLSDFRQFVLAKRLQNAPFNVDAAIDKTLNSVPFQTYRRHAGEVEARAVQARRDLTPEQRRARPPWLDYDVPENQQIVRFGDGVAESRLPYSKDSVAANLDMSQEARMARAREMGFDTDNVWYRGVDEREPFRGDSSPDTYFSDSPEIASAYAGISQIPPRTWAGAPIEEAGSIIPAHARGNLKYVDLAESKWGRKEAVDLAKSEGYDGVVLKNTRDAGPDYKLAAQNQLVIFDPKNIRSVNAAFDPAKKDSANLLAANDKKAGGFAAVNLGQDRGGFSPGIGHNSRGTRHDPGIRPDGDHADRISTRFPTTKGATENPINDRLVVDTNAMRSKPEAYSHNANLFRNYPNWPKSNRSTNPDKIVVAAQGQMVDNLLWLYNQVPEATRSKSRRWYDGARNITDRWAAKYDVDQRSVAGVLASLSPQKDWYQNVSLAERVLDVWTKSREKPWTAEMTETANRIFPAEKYKELRANIDGKSLADIEDRSGAGAWVRIYDETHHDKRFRKVSPEGDFIGEPEGNVAWGSTAEIGKAVGVLRDPSYENVSRSMGEKHKVRNFYNNILAPNSPHGDVTIDTHAVAAAMLRPLSGASTEVVHNLGLSLAKEQTAAGVKNWKTSGHSGAQGTYGILADAYREAAKRAGVLPREMQSVTWEAVRGLFPAKWKTAKNKAAADAIWNEYKHGRIGIEDVRQRIHDVAGGINEPSWLGPNPGVYGKEFDSSYAGEVSRSSVRGDAAGGMDGGTGSGTARVPARANKAGRLNANPNLGGFTMLPYANNMENKPGFLNLYDHIMESDVEQ